MTDAFRTSEKKTQPHGKPYTAWALFNWGHPWGAFRTRRQAIAECTEATGEPWSKCRKNFRVQKVKVTPL